LSKVANFDAPPAFGAPAGGDASRISQRSRHQKTRVPGLSCGVVCVILRLAVLAELRLVTDRETDGHRAMASTADGFLNIGNKLLAWDLQKALP